MFAYYRRDLCGTTLAHMTHVAGWDPCDAVLAQSLITAKVLSRL